MQLKNWPSELKHTRQREEVCDVLARANAPMSAADIYAALCGGLTAHSTQDASNSQSVQPRTRRTSCRTNLSTVYRVLEAFEQYGLVEKATIPGGDTAYYKLASGGHTHYATCLICHKQIPLTGCPAAALTLDPAALGADDFVVTGHRIELFGYCKTCAQVNKA